VFLDANARANDGPTERGWLLMSATKNEAGGFKVAVTGHQQTGPFLQLPDVMNLDDGALADLLAGGKAHLIFNGLGALKEGVSVTVEVSLYLVDGADAETPPVNPANPLARETFSATDLANAAADYDRDCDQAPDSQDMDPNGEAPPQVFGEPPSPVRLLVGETATLKAVTRADDVTFSWKSSDPRVGLSGGGDDAVHTITPSQTGVYQVAVIVTRGAAQSRFLWDVLVDAADTKEMNTPPEVKIASTAAVARVGQTVWLQAVGRDAQQSVLKFSWQASDPAVLLRDIGPRVPFVAAAPGDYKISCVASDGMADSAPATLVITVVAETTNRPPEAPAVTPLSAMVKRSADGTGKVALYARSVDPDGDPVSFDFLPDPSVSRAVTLQKKDPGNWAEVSSPVDGVFVFYVAAQDPHGAISPATAVKVQFLAPDVIITGGVDNDRDGFPSGNDCNDNMAAIFPGAREICGDGIDQNCDGRDVADTECDGDGDRFTAAMGDCNDRDPRINPGMPERCDGLDNNCNGQVDEIFTVGEPCYAGTGACRAAGKTRCSATLMAVVCDATPGTPTVEMCNDMIDNDCNGRVDDVPSRTVGTEASCGACGNTCPKPANTLAACTIVGCVAPCAQGYVDLDRDPVNGCECKVGIEICDKVDNNCNGVIDDGITEKVDATSTLGVCAGGYKVCRNGEMVEERAARLPTPEVCDGLDNDCNGKVDELFDLKYDPRNCGGCGINCGIDGKCDSGRCVGGTTPTLPPPPPPSGGGGAVQIGICPLASGGTTCVDLLSDPAHCGGCGTVCGQGMFCGLGSCVPLDKLPAGTLPPPVIRPECPLPPPPTSGGGDAGVGGCPLAMPDICKGSGDSLYCTNLLFDNASCGACGVPCPAGSLCREGRCAAADSGGSTEPAPAPSCREPFKFCSDPFGGIYCTDLLRDPRNCGGCGTLCREGTFCSQGQCITGEVPPPSACPPPSTGCPGLGDEIRCTDTYRDSANCGMCGNRCAEGTYCRDGRCVDGVPPPPTCYAPLATCKTPEGWGFCADIFRDPGHCGGCDIRCPEGTYCGDGKCLEGAPPPPPCEQPRMLCESPRGGLFCTDVLYDPTNCGACKNVCPADSYCKEGVCVSGTPPPPTCGTPMLACRRYDGSISCIDPMFDQLHCGGCDRPCSPDTRCMDGQCQAPPPPMCPPEYLVCKDPMGYLRCTDPRIDQNHCGGCDNPCSAGTYCADGRCVEGTPPPPTCESPGKLCPDGAGGSYCVDVTRDPRHCGDCGQSCPAYYSCVEGTCKEGAPPPPPPTCDPPMLMCMDPAGGSRCVDPYKDQLHCGGCGKPCAPDMHCEGGSCVPGAPPPPTCYSPMLMCMDPAGGSRCVDPYKDQLHCGGCNIACKPDEVCVEARCVLPMISCQPPKSACMPPGAAPYCADLGYDPNNCGMCGRVCAGGAPCQGGVCLPPP
jgi:hypothetical protein